MSKKGLKNFTITLTCAVYAIIGFLCLYGFYSASGLQIRNCFLGVFFRSTVSLVFFFFYYKSFASGMGPDTVLLPIFLLSSLLSDISIIMLFADVTTFCVLSPVFSSSLVVFARLAGCLAMLGFGFFYQGKERGTVTLFLLMSLAATIIITYVLPKTQSPVTLSENKAFSILLAVMYISTATLFFKYMLTDPPGIHLIRHVASLFFLVSSALTHYIPYTDYLPFLISTAFIISGYIAIIIISQVSGTKY